MPDADNDPKQTPASRGDALKSTDSKPEETSPDRKDEILEADLENTFPASDPITPSQIT